VSSAPLRALLQITQLLWEHIWSTWCADLAPIVSCLPSSSRSSDAAGSQAAAHWTPAQQQQLLLHFERWLLLLKVRPLARTVFSTCPLHVVQPCLPAANLVVMRKQTAIAPRHLALHNSIHPVGSSVAADLFLLLTVSPDAAPTDSACYHTQILRRLVLFGFPSDARSLQPVPAVNLVAPALLEALRALQPAAPAANLPSAAITAGPAPPGHTAVTLAQLAAMADRAVLKLVKTLRQIQDVHPWWVGGGSGWRGGGEGRGVGSYGRRRRHRNGDRLLCMDRARQGLQVGLGHLCCRPIYMHTCTSGLHISASAVGMAAAPPSAFPCHRLALKQDHHPTNTLVLLLLLPLLSQVLPGCGGVGAQHGLVLPAAGGGE
jgi:hypothetical protein